MEINICIAKAKSVEDFLDKYYKPGRFRGRGEEYAQCLIKSYQKEFDKNSYCAISSHDSVRGIWTEFYGEIENEDEEDKS